MKPNTPVVIPISQVTSFLCHTGSRLGSFEDPPSASVAVEGGWFAGEEFDGVVFTPTAPEAGETRVDTIVANPTSGLLELIAGVVGAGAPDLEGSTLGPIADITVVGRSNGKVIIEAADIADRRSVLTAHVGTPKLLSYGMVTLGKNQPAVNATQLLGLRPTSVTGLENVEAGYPFPEDFVVVESYYSIKGGPNNTYTVAWLVLEMQFTATDVMVQISPYNTLLRIGSDGGVGGFYWEEMPSVNVDGNGNPLPRFRIGVVASGEVKDGVRFTDPDITDKKATKVSNGFASFQVWGRA